MISRLPFHTTKTIRGFTLFELIVAIGIITTVFGIAISGYNTFNRRQRLKQTALTLKSNLRFAQTKALSAEKPEAGCTTFIGMTVSFTLTSYSVTHSCSEGLVGSADTVTLPTGITFSTLPSSFTFQALTKTILPPTGQTITLDNANQTYTITISTSGDIDEVGF